MAVPDFTVLDQTMHKAHFARLLDEIQLPQPAYKIVRTEEELLPHNEFPCWIKLDFCTAGQGVRLVKSQQDLEIIAEQLQREAWLGESREIIVQQHAEGFKRGAAGVFRKGELLAFHACQNRSIGVGGSSNAKLTVHDPEMKELMRAFGAHLNWHGAMCLVPQTAIVMTPRRDPSQLYIFAPISRATCVVEEYIGISQVDQYRSSEMAVRTCG